MNQRFLWGAHAPSRAAIGALANRRALATRADLFFPPMRVRDEGVANSTRGACAPQINRHG